MSPKLAVSSPSSATVSLSSAALRSWTGVTSIVTVCVELSPEAANWLGEKGYDDRMGARPLGRVIQEHTESRDILDVAIDPRFAENQLVYLSYAEPGEGGASTVSDLADDDASSCPVQVTFTFTRLNCRVPVPAPQPSARA